MVLGLHSLFPLWLSAEGWSLFLKATCLCKACGLLQASNDGSKVFFILPMSLASRSASSDLPVSSAPSPFSLQ